MRLKFLRIINWNNILLLSILIFTLCTRLYLLNSIPIGIVPDNVNFLLNAKAIWFTGKDISGTWNPLMLTPVPGENPQAELTYVFYVPFIGPFNFSLIHAHIFPVIINIGIIILLYLLVKRILNLETALIASFIFAVNPWSIFFGRAAYEASIALFFWLIALLLLLQDKKWLILLSLPFLALGFYTYMAFKILLLPFVIISILFASSVRTKQKRKSLRISNIIIVISSVLLLLVFLMTVKHQSTGNRLGEISLLNFSSITQEVNLERRMAINNPFQSLFSNKPINFIYSTLQKYINAYSTEQLFVQTEDTLRFRLWNHGYFYMFEIILLIAGLFFLIKNNRKAAIFLIALMLIAPIPSFLSTVYISYAQRSVIMYPVLCIIISYGIREIYVNLKKSNLRILYVCILIVAYTLFISRFLYIYFAIQPVYGSEGQAFSGRILAHYLAIASKNNLSVSVYSAQPKNEFKNYLLYTSKYTKDTAFSVKNAIASRNYRIDGLHFSLTDSFNATDSSDIIVLSSDIKPAITNAIKKKHMIAQLSDSGSVFEIINDKICDTYDLHQYTPKLNFSDLNIEKMEDREFCETYIIQYQDMLKNQ